MSDSEEFTSGDKKRLREQDGGSVFKRSKKVLRSPATNRNEEDTSTQEMLKIVLSEIKEIRRENKEYRENMEKLETEVKELKTELLETRHKMEKIENKLEQYEQQKRKENIIIKGLKLNSDSGSEYKESVKNFIKQNLKVDVEIASAHRLNDMVSVVQMANFEAKIKVMENKNKLRSYAGGNVYIENDLTVKERGIQKQIRDVARNERQKGNVAKVGFNKLIINGIKWVWNREMDTLQIENTAPKK